MSVKDFFVKTGRRIKSNFGWKSALFLVICIGMLATDLLTKHFAEADGWQFTVIPGFIEVVEVIHNDGASLGMGGGTAWAMPLFITLTFIAVPIFIAVILMLPERAALLKFCLYMALAGAIGNLVDRLAFGYVRDFIGMNGIDCVAFERPDGKIALIVVNDNSSARKINVEGEFSSFTKTVTDDNVNRETSEGEFDGSVSVSPMSVTTFVLS